MLPNRAQIGPQIRISDKGRHVHDADEPGAKTIKKNTNSTQNNSETHHAKQYEVTSFLSTDCELSTETCSENVYSLGPKFSYSNVMVPWRWVPWDRELYKL